MANKRETIFKLDLRLEVRLRANGLEKMVLKLQADHLQVMHEEVAA